MYFAAIAFILLALIPHKHFAIFLAIYDKALKKLIFYLPLISGNQFKKNLFSYEEKIYLGEVVRLNPDDKYKFYPEILMMLQEQTLKKGVQLKKNFLSFKKSFLRDLESEKQIFQILQGGVFQFLMISFATWIFIFFSGHLIDYQVSFKIIFIILLLQSLGFCLFFLISFKIRKHKFQNLEKDVFKIILFTSLLECGTPLNLALAESQVLQIKNLDELLEFIKKFIERGRKTGEFNLDDIEEIRHSFWYHYNEKITIFKKNLEFLKFLILTFLFLPAYFVYLTSIFQFFVEH